MREIRFRVQIPGRDDPRGPEYPDRRFVSGARILAGIAVAMLTVYLLETKPLPDAAASADPAQVELDVQGEPRSVTITSTGNSPLRIRAVTVRGPDAAAFAIVRETCDHAYLLQRESCLVDLQFLGDNDGHGELLVTDNAEDGPLVVGLHAGPRSVVSVSKLVPQPTSLGFGTVRVASAGEQQPLIVRVVGHSAVQIDRIATEPSAEFRVAVDTCSQRTLGGGQSCRLGVVFVPRAAGPRSGRLEVVPHAPSDPVRVPLGGTGVIRPDLEIDPNPLVFQATPKGSRAERAVRVTLIQKKPSRFAKATVSGPNQRDFSIANDGCGGKALTAVPSCTIRIRFAPRGTGERAATLTLAAQDKSAVTTLARVDLRGQGVGPSSLVLDPPSLSFAAERLNVASTAQTVVVTKTGPGTLTVESVTFFEGGGLGTDLASILGGGKPSPHFTASGDCVGKVMDEGSRCEIVVRFSPSAYGDHHGFLAVKPSGSAFPVTARLAGSGPSEPAGWCCVIRGESGTVSAQTIEECKRMKGKYYPPEQQQIAQRECIVIR